METARKQGCDRDRQRSYIGPGWGNGRAVALRLAEEGAKIYMVDRNSTLYRIHSNACAQWMEKLLLWRAT